MNNKDLAGYAQRVQNDKRRSDLARGDGLVPQERRALRTLRREAAERDATLASGGKGGLPPSFVLGVMRRDGYACKRCGKDQDLTIHHKGGIVASKWLSKKGHNLEFDNLVTLCATCHDAIHQEARAEGEDSSQVKPEGDEG